MAFADCVVPQEYGLHEVDKVILSYKHESSDLVRNNTLFASQRTIGSKLCNALLEKIKHDLMAVQSNCATDQHYLLDHSHAEDLAINSLSRSVRTRLYFTSESHLHTLLNVLRYPKEGQPCAFSSEGLRVIEKTPELGYLTQVSCAVITIEFY
jgi:Histidine phosphatase superfamily (branch 2)